MLVEGLAGDIPSLDWSAIDKVLLP